MRFLLILLALPLLVPAGASAATVSRSSEFFSSGDDVLVHTVTVEAAAGDVNDVTLTAGPAFVEVRDAGVAPVAGSGCAAAGPSTVRCSLPGSADLVRVEALVRLGDGNDRALIGLGSATGGLVATVEGGDGSDAIDSPGIIEGGAGNDTITGTAAGEGMSGGPGDDVLRGLGGRDQLVGDTEPQDGGGGAPEGNDVIDGGDGRDLVFYGARSAPVTIDLPAGVAGGPGESDALVSIEDAVGGQAADTITGTEGPNQLDGLRGADVIRAAGGNDRVIGGSDVDAGAGDDRLVAPRGDFVCGSGRDRVADARRPLATDCELAQLDTRLTAGPRPQLRGGAVRVALRSTCGCRYRGPLTVKHSGKVLARGRASVPRRGRATAVLPLTAAGRAALDEPTVVRITFRARDIRMQFTARLP